MLNSVSSWQARELSVVGYIEHMTTPATVTEEVC